MEIRVLKYFLTVVREENITKAASVLHITQPTLSRQLAQLEEETGVTLFRRGTRRIVLTNEGILLRRRAEEIVSLVDKTERELVERDELVDGCVSIGCGVAVAVQNLAELIGSFQKAYPLVTYNLYTGAADLVQERIDRGLLDMGLLMEPVDVDKYEYIRLPLKDRWGVFMRPDDPLAQKEALTAQDLAALPLSIVSRLQAKSEVANWFGDYFNKLNIRFTSNLSTNASIMVHNGLSYGVLLEGSMPFIDKAQLSFRPLSPPLPASSLLAWKRGQPYSLAVTKFIAHAKCFLSMERT